MIKTEVIFWEPVTHNINGPQHNTSWWDTKPEELKNNSTWLKKTNKQLNKTLQKWNTLPVSDVKIPSILFVTKENLKWTQLSS